MTWTRKKVILATLVLLGLSGLVGAVPAAAQSDIDRRVWTTISVQGQAGGAWRWSSDSLVRATDGAGALDIVGERVTVSRRITPQSSAGLGYAWAGGVFHGRFLQEHRFAEQYTWSGTGRVRVSLRSRLEECWLTGEDAMRLQARQRVKVVWPLLAKERLQGVASEELFLQSSAATWIPRDMDSNEAFVGIARRLTARSGLEIGYMSFYSKDGYRGHHRSHVLAALLGVSL
jgi:uncharacterized protein DUF2490